MGRGNPRTWQKWCKKTYNTYCGMSNDWDDPESVLITVRDFYTTIHDCGNPNPSGYISYNALQNKLEKRKTVTDHCNSCLLYTSPSPRDRQKSRMPSSA